MPKARDIRMAEQGRRAPAEGFSLVELMIALMILGIGMVMIAGAFPVGLAFHEEAIDETIAGLLARTAVSRLTLLRTRDQYTRNQPPGGDPDWGGQERKDGGYRDFWGHLSIVECFEDSTELQWLFDSGQHAGGLLTTQQLGSNIDTWLPKRERIYRSDEKYGFQIFYHRVADPGTGDLGGSMTFVAYVAVQKADVKESDTEPYDLLPTPRKATVASTGSENSITLSGGGTVAAGAILGTVEDGSWYTVRNVDGDGTLHLTRSPSGLEGKQVWVVNQAVEVFAAVVNKQRVSGS